ncbi:MAG TPA: NADPH:quinone oxidoreductase family protein [Candidatus Angelobacter sp.]|nr:NADPH:quinone oxidoreductase family protein [Candidatus Angelobacter sp.]
MKAIFVTRLEGPEGLELRDVEKPKPAPNQVLIRVAATSVNFADIKSTYGNYHNAGNPPFIPGLDAAGTIEAVGSEITNFKVGERVIGFPKNGSYAEYIVIEEPLVFSIPDSIDFETAAACPTVSFTSYKLLADVARLEKGETVLIHAAAGGIGTTAIQLAKILGAGKIIGAVSSLEKESVALEVGADHVITYDGFSGKVNELTGGMGADVILDSLAGEITEESMLCLAPYGRLVNFGNATGRAGQISSYDLHSSCRSILGFSLGTTRNKRPELLQSAAKTVLPLLAEGLLKMSISCQFSLGEATMAQAFVESRRSTGKVILTVS